MLQSKSADDWYAGTLKNKTQTYKYVDFFLFQPVLIFLIT
jgi:hypothetical protein